MKRVRATLKPKDIVVDHDTTAGEFFVALSHLNLGEEKATLKYRMSGNNTVDFYSTFVPRKARGRGIAEALVEVGLAWAKKTQYKQQASCWYVKKSLSNQTPSKPMNNN